MNQTEILKKLCQGSFISGNEASLYGEVCSLLPDAEVSKDNIGNIYIKIGEQNAKNHIAIDAHCDQIGFVVTNILENGFLKVAPVGGVDKRAAYGSRVEVMGKKTLEGVFTSIPPHLSQSGDTKFPNIDELSVDIGVSKSEAEQLTNIGDYVCLKNNFVLLGKNRVCSAALDNKIGVAAVLSLALKLCQNKIKNLCTTFILSVQEEAGLRGATAGNIKGQDVIVIDTSFGSYPGAPNDKTGQLSKGIMLGHSPILSRSLTEKIESFAEKNSISIQHEILPESTGTNADKLSLYNSCALLSVPILNMHTAVEIADLRDFNSLICLLESFLREEYKNA